MRIFISYAYKDKSVCIALANTLRESGNEVLIDQDSVSVGENILETLIDSINSADLFIAIITGNYLASDLAQTELSATILRSSGVKLLPVVVGELFVPYSISDIQYLKVSTLDGVVSAVVQEIKKLSTKEDVITEDTTRPSTQETLEEKIGLLKNALSRNRLTLVCGAGVSQTASVPGWRDLLLGILEELFISKDSDSSKVNTNELIRRFPKSNIIVSKYLKLLLGDNFESRVRDRVYKEFNAIEETDWQMLTFGGYVPEVKYYHSSELLHEIVNLARPTRAGKRLESIITFNFDDLIEYSLRCEGVECSTIWKEGQRHDKDVLPIYHVHGFLPRSGELDNPSLVFSEDAYHSQFIDPYSWSNLLQLNTYSNNTCLFVGLSLEDPNLRRLLDIAYRKYNSQNHYAIMKIGNPETPVEKIHSTLFEQDVNSLGLNVIGVSDYSEIPGLLRKIVK